MTPRLTDLYEWGAVVDLWPTAASVFGLSRTQTYDLASRDEFPCRVLRVGSRLLKVSTADLLTALGMPLNPANDKGPSASTAPALVALDINRKENSCA